MSRPPSALRSKCTRQRLGRSGDSVLLGASMTPVGKPQGFVLDRPENAVGQPRPPRSTFARRRETSAPFPTRIAATGRPCRTARARRRASGTAPDSSRGAGYRRPARRLRLRSERSTRSRCAARARCRRRPLLRAFRQTMRRRVLPVSPRSSTRARSQTARARIRTPTAALAPAPDRFS